MVNLAVIGVLVHARLKLGRGGRCEGCTAPTDPAPKTASHVGGGACGVLTHPAGSLFPRRVRPALNVTYSENYSEFDKVIYALELGARKVRRFGR